MQEISWMKVSKVIILSLFVLFIVVGETVSAMNLSADTTVFTIAKNGKTNYCIVVPDKASPVIEYAAGELQRFLEEISGAKLSIIPASSAREGHAFLIGLSKRVRKAGLEDELGKLKEDGVLVKTVGKDVVLLGQNDRGQLYSVYVLLERFLGVRFLAWDCTVVPKRRMLTLPNIDYAYSPPFMSREVLYYNAYPKQIAARQRLNGSSTECDSTVGGKITIYPYVHSFDDLVPPDEYFKDHPEYFSLINGKRVGAVVHSQLCLTNPDVLSIATGQVLKWIKEHPDAIIDVSQNDGNGWCECNKCMAVANEEGSQHGPILRFVNAIADVVAEKYPDKWIETLAYAYSTKPPALTKPHHNVIIRLCHAGCYFHGFEQCGLGANLTNNIEGWSKLTKRIFIWQYAANFSHYVAPNQNLNGLAKDIKYYASHGVNGLMVQADHQGPGGELAELRQYLVSQLMWNPSRDPIAVRVDFCKGYYGLAGDDVLAFLSLMDKLSEDSNIHVFASWDSQNTVPSSFVADGLTILNRTRAKACDSKIIANRIDKLLLPLWYMQLTYPDRYGLAEKDAPELWSKFRKVVDANKITFIRESFGVDAKGKWFSSPSMPGYIAEMDARFIPLPKDVVYNLLRIDKVKIENCADWRLSTVKKEGRLLRTIFQHPNAQGDADASYEIPLSTLQDGKKLVLWFETVITAPSSNGVRFTILVNGKELWRETQTEYLSANESRKRTAQDDILPTKNPFRNHSLDLSKWAGQTIKLTLRVNGLGDTANDWANWVEPRITIEN